MSILQAIIIAVVEGITEFLPISSTGHMIITNHLMGIQDDAFVKLYIIVIQLGAILSVVVLYWKKFFMLGNLKQMIDFYLKLLVAFLPAAVFGVLFASVIDSMLGNVVVVGISLLAGGIVLLFVDRIFQANEGRPEEPIGYAAAFKVGLFQVISMIPGISRAAATIIGGLSQKFNRRQAAEFSFFLAVPTMLGATAKDLYEKQELLTTANIGTLLLGCFVAFVVAMIAIKMFISFLTRNGFRLFGYYRIIVGAIILLLVALNKGLQMI